MARTELEIQFQKIWDSGLGFHITIFNHGKVTSLPLTSGPHLQSKDDDVYLQKFCKD